MAHFEINLIRDQVMPRAFRKGLFWGMLTYLMLFSVGLAIVVHRSALRFVDATEHRREMRVIEKQFQGDHPNEKSVLSCAQGFRDRMNQSADVLDGIDSALRQRVSLSRILLGLAKPLPEDCLLVNIDLQAKKGNVQFSVMTPALKAQTLTAGQIIDLWGKDGTLGAEIKEIRAETSQRQFSSGRPVLVHRFSAALATGPGGE